MFYTDREIETDNKSLNQLVYYFSHIASVYNISTRCLSKKTENKNLGNNLDNK